MPPELDDPLRYLIFGMATYVRYAVDRSPDQDRMATDAAPEPKVHVALRLPKPLVRFLDQRAKERFTTRNEVIQSLVVEAFHSAQGNT
jgi:hypothetical protein